MQMQGHRRNHFVTVLDYTASSLIKLLIPLWFLLFRNFGKLGPGLPGTTIRLIIFSGILVCIFVFSVTKWYRKTYAFGVQFLTLREGVFSVKRREIPYNRIQTVSITRNLKQRIFGLAEVKIDTGSSNTAAAEASLVVADREAERVREFILGARDGIEGKGMKAAEPAGDDGEQMVSRDGKRDPDSANAGYSVSGRELVLMSLTSNALFAGIAFIGSVFALLNDWIEPYLDRMLGGLESFFTGLDFGHLSPGYLVLSVIAVLAVYLLFSITVSFVTTFVKYYGFHAGREGENLTIRFGLLEVRKYILPIRKIKAVYIRQNLFRQVLGLYSLHVESTGYGNEKGEASILFPIASGKRVEELICRLVPEFRFAQELTPVPRKSLYRFVVSASRIPFLLCLGATVFWRLGYLSFLVLPCFMLMGYLEYRNSAVGSNQHLLCIRNRAFGRTVSLILQEGVQAVIEASNYFQRRRNLFNFEVSIQSSQFGKIIRVRNLDAAMKERLIDFDCISPAEKRNPNL